MATWASNNGEGTAGDGGIEQLAAFLVRKRRVLPVDGGNKSVWQWLLRPGGHRLVVVVGDGTKILFPANHSRGTFL
jgi:hypothetical protein